MKALSPITEQETHETEAFYTVTRDALASLHWKGTERNFREAFSAQPTRIGLKEFRTIMARLGYTSEMRAGASKIFPSVFIDKTNKPTLIKNASDRDAIGSRKGTWLTFEDMPNDTAEPFVKMLLKRFGPILAQSVFISLLIGVVSLAPVFYNMAVYDTVLPVSSPQALTMLFVGVAAALATEIVLRRKRNKILGYFGARLDQYVGCSVFQRLMALPPFYIERASVSAQLARLRDFDSIREFFTGSLATLFFEMPLVLVYTGIMACIAGKLALIPVVLLLAYTGLLWGMNGSLKGTARQASAASSYRQEFVLESLTKLRAIRLAGMENVWRQRYKDLSDSTSEASLRASMTAQGIEVTSYVFMTLGGVATLSFGVLQVIDKDMTTGALIASMILIWRIISPMQMCCASITRVQQLFAGTAQVQRLLSTQSEQDQSRSERLTAQLKGNVTFHRVSIRYTPDSEPALLGVSFDVKPGQIVAIRGENGSGKSSILKLILGMYQPQGGSVRLDGIDLRQFDPVALRQTIAYVPQNVELLPGTLRDNLLYADPTAMDEDCINALSQACAWGEVKSLPQGLDTLIAGEGAETISFMLIQKIGLARAYIKSCKIILFDEASHSLGKENDAAFAKMIESARGKCTVIMATHREDHMRLADILLVMKKGELIASGAPTQVLTALQGKRA